MLYLCFFISLCLGPVPLNILSLKIDYIITSALLFFSFFYLKKTLTNKFKITVLLFALYIILIFPSVIWSQNFSRYAITIIYFTLFLFISHSVEKSLFIKYRQIALLALMISAVIILYSFFFSGYSHEHGRFRLLLDPNLWKTGDLADILNNSADPNMTAIGLVMVLSFVTEDLENLSSKKSVFTQLSIVITTSVCVALLQSRTAFLMLLLLGALWLAKNRPRTLLRTLFVYSLGIIATYFVIVSNHVLTLYFSSLIDRFLNAIVEAKSSTGRIDYLISDFHYWTESIFNFLLGIGYMNSNPHNEFYRNLTNSGLLVGVFFLIILLVYTRTIHRQIRTTYKNDWGIIYLSYPFFVALSLYGHTKTFWAFLILCQLKVFRIRSGDNTLSTKEL